VRPPTPLMPLAGCPLTHALSTKTCFGEVDIILTCIYLSIETWSASGTLLQQPFAQHHLPLPTVEHKEACPTLKKRAGAPLREHGVHGDGGVQVLHPRGLHSRWALQAKELPPQARPHLLPPQAHVLEQWRRKGKGSA